MTVCGSVIEASKTRVCWLDKRILTLISLGRFDFKSLIVSGGLDVAVLSLRSFEASRGSFGLMSLPAICSLGRVLTDGVASLTSRLRLNT